MKNTIKRLLIFFFIFTSFLIWSKPVYSEEPTTGKGGIDCSKLQEDKKALRKNLKDPVMRFRV